MTKFEIEDITAHFKVGDKCVCDHPAAFRCGKEFTIVSINLVYLPDRDILRYAYVQMFDDGRLDSIPVTDEKECRMRKVKKHL